MVHLYRKLPTYLKLAIISSLAAILVFGGALIVGAVSTGPIISDLSPAKGQALTNAATTISFKVNAADGIDDPSISVSLNGKLIPVTIVHPQIGHSETLYDSCTGEPYVVWVVDGTDTKNATVKSSGINAEHVNDVVITVKDQLGKSSTETYSFTCSMFRNFSPANGASITNPSTKISFEVFDSKGINDASLQLKVNGQLIPITINHPNTGYWLTCSGSAWVDTGPDPNSATVTADFNASDINNVEVTGKDNSGEADTATWTFKCDQVPTISDVSPANGSFVSSVPAISAKVTDNGTIDQSSITLKVAGVNHPVVFDPNTGIVSYTPSPALAEGGYDVYLDVKDTGGLHTQKYWNFVVTSDSSGPVIDNIAPADSSSISNSNSIIGFSLNDDIKIDTSSINVKFNGTDVNYSLEDVSGPINSEPVDYVRDIGTYSAKYNVSANVYAKDHNTVLVTAKDVLGHSTSVQWNFDCMLSPVISGAAPTGSVKQSSLPVVTAKLTDNGLIDASSIILKVDSNIVNHTYNATTGIVSYTPPLPLTPGTHNFSLEVKDTASNPANLTWSCDITGDSAGPVISGLEPADGSSLSQTSSQLKFTAFDQDGINNGSLKVTFNGAPISAIITNPRLGYYEFRTMTDSCTGQTYTAKVWVDQGPDTKNVTVTATLINIKTLNQLSIVLADKLGNATVIPITFKTTILPTITANTPLNMYVTDTQPTISAKVSSVNGTIDQASITFKVDGTKVNHTYTPSSNSAGTVSYTPAIPLANGGHTADLAVKDDVGNTKSLTWSFGTGTSEATFSDASPALDSTVNIANPEISVKAADTIDLGSYEMKLNGNPVTPTVSYEQLHGLQTVYDSCTGESYQVWGLLATYYNKPIFKFKPSSIPDGKNDVILKITNKWGGVSTYTWSFNAKVPPQVSSQSPAPGGTTNTRTPVVTAKLTDNSTVASYQMLLDNNLVSPTYDATSGFLSFTSPKLPNGTDHTVKLTVYDEMGTSTDSVWSFHVETFAAMPTNCGECHYGFPGAHPMSNCDSCHGNADYGHGDYGCGQCHGEHGSGHLTGKCNECHGTRHSEVTHLTKTNMTSCGECHSGTLTFEHNRHIDSNGNTLTCGTCHNNPNTKISQAISSDNTACDACHNASGHDELHVDTLDKNCQTCHGAYLTQEHLNRKDSNGINYGCGTCHDSSAKEVIRTISAESMSCAGCHVKPGTGHPNITFTDAAPSDIPLYSSYRWSSPMEASVFLGEKTVPPNFETGQVIVSNRRNDVTVDTIANFYKTELQAKGWTLSTSNYNPNCIAYFVKGTRELYVVGYSTENPDGTGSNIGLRIELWYK